MSLRKKFFYLPRPSIAHKIFFMSVTELLNEWSNGDKTAMERLIPLVHDELYKIASAYMKNERPSHTLQATALINEAYMRLVDQKNVQWQGRIHFYRTAALVMRNILVNHALKHKAEKRGGGNRLTLDEVLDLPNEQNLEILALNDALKKLATIDKRKSQIIELRFFGGLNLEETAKALGVSLATINREWRMAKAWLYREMKEG